jgi:hypothetical protein
MHEINISEKYSYNRAVYRLEKKAVELLNDVQTVHIILL